MPSSMSTRKNRPSPTDSATFYPAGHRMRGNDGNMWIIRTSANGVDRWVKEKKSADSTEKKSVKPRRKPKTYQTARKSTGGKTKTAKTKTVVLRKVKNPVTGRWILATGVTAKRVKKME